MFAGNLPALSANNTVITWDVRGHGRSDYPDDPAQYSPQLAVGDMVAILDAVGVERAVIGGHSLGGYLSLRFHLAAPRPRRRAGADRHRPGLPQGRGTRRLEQDGRRTTRPSFERRGLDALGEQRRGAAATSTATPPAWSAPPGASSPSSTRQVIESLPGIAVPTLVIVGEDDTPFLDGSRYMAAKIPGARLAVIPDAGHAPNIANPAEFERVVAEFPATFAGAVTTLRGRDGQTYGRSRSCSSAAISCGRLVVRARPPR